MDQKALADPSRLKIIKMLRHWLEDDPEMALCILIVGYLFNFLM
jgi:hypothetical protein